MVACSDRGDERVDPVSEYAMPSGRGFGVWLGGREASAALVAAIDSSTVPL